MANVKISPKGRALLNKKLTSGSVARAIVEGGAALASPEGISVSIGGKTLRLQAASPVSNHAQPASR